LKVDVEALTKQNGVRLFGKFKKKFKKKVKTDLPYLSFYKKKPETHIFFFGPMYIISRLLKLGMGLCFLPLVDNDMLLKVYFIKRCLHFVSCIYHIVLIY
jgi:hypothetical protein